MSMQDPIADMLTRIRNAGMAMRTEVSMPCSRMKTAIADVLKSEGYIVDYKVKGEGVAKELVLELKYRNKIHVIEGVDRVSKPSCRIYCGGSEIPKVRNGLGITILSTPNGIRSGRVAESENVGGEILCKVW
ncbi:MAG: 30S ribosomal protein S8 [Kiritimatiellaeota bacterium]|nr:30S ribosomal protein S8 [Kiritimatiellota bacterium]